MVRFPLQRRFAFLRRSNGRYPKKELAGGPSQSSDSRCSGSRQAASRSSRVVGSRCEQDPAVIHLATSVGGARRHHEPGKPRRERCPVLYARADDRLDPENGSVAACETEAAASRTRQTRRCSGSPGSMAARRLAPAVLAIRSPRPGLPADYVCLRVSSLGTTDTQSPLVRGRPRPLPAGSVRTPPGPMRIEYGYQSDLGDSGGVRR